MGITTRTFDYSGDGETFEGYLALPEGDARKPVVLVAHAWAGQTDMERGKADRIAAELGYAAFAIDVYGKGKRGTTVEENQALMNPLVGDRAKLQRRLSAAVDTAKTLDGVDTSKRVAAGFCFGGLCVLDMARAGMDVAGVASFHGLFGAPDNLSGYSIDAKVIAYHGWKDPMAPPDDVIALSKEMAAANADWQLMAFGTAFHSFTTPGANNPDMGTMYETAADNRSWWAFRGFLKEVLG
ncbi:MAG: dienelactone hydrolase family protein [Pseudomonadota bacterium]